jgi:hypothetical protein
MPRRRGRGRGSRGRGASSAAPHNEFNLAHLQPSWYGCTYCPADRATKEALWAHMRAAHPDQQTDPETPYKIVYVGLCTIEACDHVCLLCNQPVQHEEEMLDRHMRQFHRITAVNYYLHYIAPDANQ